MDRTKIKGAATTIKGILILSRHWIVSVTSPKKNNNTYLDIHVNIILNIPKFIQ